jgi:hypothetical protein
MSTYRSLALVLPLVMVVACAQHDSYAGDGRLIDNGITAAETRYVAEVGRVDLAHSGTAKFEFSGLPRTYFVVGLQMPARAALGADGRLRTGADVSFEIVRVDYGMVAVVTAPLREWTLSNRPHGDAAFAYLRRSQSYFDAFPEAHYRLTVTVNVPDPSLPPDSWVVLESAGWK